MPFVYDNIILGYNINNMTTISVPIPENLNDFINQMVANGEAETKAEVVRKALRRYAEDEIMFSIMKSRQDYKEGRFFESDLLELAHKVKNSEKKSKK